MAVDEYYLVELDPVDTRTIPYRVRMRDGGDYREAELKVANEDDATTVASSQLGTLWEAGTESTAAAFVAARERANTDYYKNVQLSVYGVLAAGGTLAQMNATGETALAADGTKQAEWQAYKAALGGDDLTAVELHMAMMQFTLIGRQAAGG